jgi:hypothetical protein
VVTDVIISKENLASIYVILVDHYTTEAVSVSVFIVETESASKKAWKLIDF